jgi:3-oxoadipate enol-lactonase
VPRFDAARILHRTSIEYRTGEYRTGLTSAAQTAYLTENQFRRASYTMPTKYADVLGCATYYYYVGRSTLPDIVPDRSRGHTIVLIHAAGSNAHTWQVQYDHLGVAHSPFAPDLPGHGRSAGVEALAKVEDYADFIVAFLDSLKIDSAVVMGRSMGGAVAMDLAVRYPSRVQALALIATAAKFDLDPELIATWRAVTMGRTGQPFTNRGYSPKTIASRPELIREGWGEQIRTDPRTRWGDMVACSKVDLRGAIGGIKQPTLVIAGADDDITPPAAAQALQGAIKGSRLEVIPDAGHYVTTEQAAAVNAALDQFLSGLR